MTNRYIVTIGSNFRPEQQVAETQRLIVRHFDNVRFTPFRWTPPYGERYTSAFYNAAVIFSSPLSPEELKAKLKSFEVQLGRTPEQKQAGIVPIDLDIIAVNKSIIHVDYERFPFVKEAVDALLSGENE